MRLTPRYDTTPILAVEARRPGPHPLVQQRRRLDAVLGALGDDEWSAPSRCEAWTVQDVITHVDSTNQFWALSITQALAGEPTRFLGTFDPVASPADLVERTRGRTPRETLDAFRTSNAALLDVVEALDEHGWDAIGEAPPGHVPVRLVADHALWDSWVHERDVLLPIGRAPVEDPGEVLTALRYASGLGQAFEVVHRGQPGGEAALDVADLDVRIVVTATRDQVRIHDGPPASDARVVRMDSTPLLEMLSRREAGRPAPPELSWFTAGVARVFDQVEGDVAS